MRKMKPENMTQEQRLNEIFQIIQKLRKTVGCGCKMKPTKRGWALTFTESRISLA